jgi:hypothetical protein
MKMQVTTNFVTFWFRICLPYLIVADEFTPQHGGFDSVVVVNVARHFCKSIAWAYGEKAPPPSKGRLHTVDIRRYLKDHTARAAS